MTQASSEVGPEKRACPYCASVPQAGAAVVICGVCGALHHHDCWQENGGCAVVACAGGPGTAPDPAPPPSPQAGLPPITPPVPGAPTFQVPPGKGGPMAPPAYAGPPHAAPESWIGEQQPARSAGPWIAVAIVILALAIAGSAAALLLAGGDEQQLNASDDGAPAPAAVAPEEDRSSAAAEADAAEPEPDRNGVFPDVSRSQMNSDITSVLRRHHQAIVDGRPEAAWALLTERKQQQIERRDGFAVWQRNQATLAPYLDPSGVRARIQDLDEETGVALVMVTGMGWFKPGASCSEWSGLTWVRYERGRWRYDPGYSTTPQRERRFKDRFGELLGGSC